MQNLKTRKGRLRVKITFECEPKEITFVISEYKNEKELCQNKALSVEILINANFDAEKNIDTILDSIHQTKNQVFGQ